MEKEKMVLLFLLFIAFILYFTYNRIRELQPENNYKLIHFLFTFVQ
jgi:hypothetical protein